MSEAQDAAIKKAYKVLRDLSNDPEIVRLAGLRDKAIQDEISNMNVVKAEGKQEGKQEEKFDVVRRMLKAGSSVEFISQITDLTIEEVSKLKH